MSFSIVTQLLLKEYEEYLEHQRDRKPNEIWVSELVQCKAKAQLRQQYPFFYQAKPACTLGNLVHYGIYSYLLQELGLETEKEFKEYIEGWVIKGRIDGIDDKCVYEIKYARELKDNQPFEHHVLQVKLYLWLTGKPEGKLIYITPNRLVEFSINESLSDDEVEQLIEQWTSPRYDWECNYCEFVSICPYAKKK